MTVTSATFANAQQTHVNSVINGAAWAGTSLAAIAARDGQIPSLVADWIDAGGVIAPYVAPSAAVPESVTNYQARAALLQAGLFATVDTMIKTLPVTDPVFQAWEYANNVYRNSPFIVSLGGSLGLTAAQIDGLFILAASIDS